MMTKKLIILIGFLLLAACTQPGSSTPPPQDIPFTAQPATVTPSQFDQSTGTPVPVLTNLPTAIPSPTPTHPALPGPEIHTLPGPLFDTIIQIPIGEEGILYRGAGVTDMEPVGPNGIVMTPDGLIVIGDMYGNRLMRYDLTGRRLADIDLTALDILNISDLVGIDDSLYILEISFKALPERYRINQLTTEGQLVRQYDLPEGFHFEDGLFSLAVGYPEGVSAEILVQLGNADDSRYYRLPAHPDLPPIELPALPVLGENLHMHSARLGELAATTIGPQEFESQMTTGGTIFLLSAREDGSLYLERDDLVAWEPITTDITVHYVTSEGKLAGVARYPLMDWYFPILRFLTVGPDGNVYGLITRQQSVEVLRLNFYNSLEPILSTAVKPTIRIISAGSIEAPAYDCSLVRHIPTDSAGATEIVDSLITNYKQDRPTEYLAFEQLWSVDRVEGYAIIQGMVTQEETDIIVAHETERGFVLVGWYIAQLPIPGFRNDDIPGYLAAQVPEAPTGLFYCLDLSRFIVNQE